MSSFVIDDYRLDITPQGNYPVVYLSQFEDGRDIRFYMLNRGRSFTIPTGISAFVSGLKSNGGYYEHSCTIDGNYIIMHVEADMTDAYGRGLANIKLTNQSGDTVISAKFVVNVQESVSDSGVEVPTVAETIFQQLLDEIRQRSAIISVNVTQLNNNVTQFMADINNEVNVIDNNVSAVDARMDTFIAQHSGVAANSTKVIEDELWSGEVGDDGYIELDLLDFGASYDYIDVYVKTGAKCIEIKRTTPDVIYSEGGFHFALANITDTQYESNLPLGIYEFSLIGGEPEEAPPGTEGWIMTYITSWRWSGVATEGSIQRQSTVSYYKIVKLVGVKYEDVEASKDSELTDIRVGVDGTVYTTAGAAVRGQISDVNSELTAITTALPSDVGKVLKVKTVTNGKVTEWEFGETGGGDDETRRLLGSTPLTLSEDTDIQLVASSNTEYSYGAPIVTDFANREGERLTNATITEGDGYYEVEATEDATAYYESYVRIYLNNLTVGEEYAVNIYPQVNAGEEVTGGTCAIYDSEGNPIKVINTVDTPVTDTFLATETSMRLRVLPAGAYFWDRGYRKARFTNIVVEPVSDEFIASDFSKRENVALTNVTLTEEDGYYEIAATEDATSYANAYADMLFSGLTVGKDYVINVVPNGSSSDSASGGMYQFMTFDGDTIGELILLNEAGQLEFTATSNTIRLRLYVASAYLWNNGYTKGRLSSLTITEKTSGTFTGTLDLGILTAGTEIRSTPSCQVYKITESEKQDDVQKSRHAGKICVCFGDSVTGFLSPPYDYPSVIAEETGMTVYNVGFAGCRMSDTHPYPAYKRFGMVPLVDAIVSGDWSEQEAYVGQIEDGTFPRAHLNNLKNMDWSKVDFATIFYGANDAGNGIPLGDPTGKNTETLLGAFNYAIEKFMTAYPHIKLLILTPIFRYWYDEGKDSDEMEIPEYGTENVRKYYEWGDALMERAKVYKLPTVDMYRTLGINTFNKATYLKNDGAHPRNIGSALIGGKIAGKLLSEY